jgi:WD40 repeat protein/cytochrome c551/c552
MSAPVTARGAEGKFSGDDAELARRAMTLLRENCVACHNPEKKKGGLVLTSRAAALAGGKDGPVLAPGKAEKSPLAAAVLADAETHMPPKGQLTDGEIATLRRWIDAGAAWDEAALVASRPASATTAPVQLRPLPASYRPVLCLAIAPGDKRLAVGRGDRILIYDLSQPGRPLLRELATPNDVVQSLAWSGDGRWLASGGFRRIRIWDANSGIIAREIGGLSGRVTALAVVAKGDVLIAGEGEVASPSMVRLWHIPDGRPIGQWTAHADSILAMRVSADGRMLVTAGADKLVKIWDLPARQELAKLEGHAGPVIAVALKADGTQLASAGVDKEVKIWNPVTREQTATLQTHPAAVTDLAWLNDGKTLLSSSEDGVVRFSSAANKERAERTFTGAPDVLYTTAITADGKTIFAGCHDGRVYVWSAANGKAEGKLIVPEEIYGPARVGER